VTFKFSDPITTRHTAIRNFAERSEPVIAVLLAAASFEWTVRRALVAMSCIPNRDVRCRLSKCSTLDGYKALWGEVVAPTRGATLPKVVQNWGAFRGAFELRHRLIHGRQPAAGKKFAEEQCERVLSAATDVHMFAKDRGVDLDRRLPIRRR